MALVVVFVLWLDGFWERRLRRPSSFPFIPMVFSRIRMGGRVRLSAVWVLVLALRVVRLLIAVNCRGSTIEDSACKAGAWVVLTVYHDRCSWRMI